MSYLTDKNWARICCLCPKDFSLTLEDLIDFSCRAMAVIETLITYLIADILERSFPNCCIWEIGLTPLTMKIWVTSISPGKMIIVRLLVI